MNQDILSNVETFLHLLKTANGADVSQWDEEALSKALRWAEYAEQLHSKLCHKPEALEKLNIAVKRIQQQSEQILHRRQITADDLGVSRNLLMKTLLQNSHLPSQLYLQMLPTLSEKEWPAAKSGNVWLKPDDFLRFTEKCALLKLTCKQLTEVDTRLGVCGTSDTDILIDARILRRHLLLCSTQEGNTVESSQRHSSLLHAVAAKPGGLEVIGSVLALDSPDKTGGASDVNALEQFVFDWLMKNKQQYISQTTSDRHLASPAK